MKIRQFRKNFAAANLLVAAKRILPRWKYREKFTVRFQEFFQLNHKFLLTGNVFNHVALHYQIKSFAF